MKYRTHQQSPLLHTLAACVFCATASHAGTVNTTFSFQKGDLRQDGELYGTGASYTGVVDGALTDSSATFALTTGATATMGNQWRNIAAVTNALAQADKKLFLTANVAITAWAGGSD